MFSLVLLCLSAIPAILFCSNLRHFHRAAHIDHSKPLQSEEPVSVLIPARNEELGIRATLNAVLASDYTKLEVIVMDDASTDSTSEIVNEICRQDSRLSLVISQPLPPGWNGKQFACWQLAQAAHFDWLLFLDADVLLSRDAIERLYAEAASTHTDLLSGFPYQQTLTVAEKMLIPLMHFILLGYLPIARMRASRGTEFAAGCGQLFLARRESYFQCGGHQAIQVSRHDGLALPRAFRKQRLIADIIDATDIATCRMYRSWPEVMRGLLKNATEGIAQPKLIVPLSILLLGGAVLPVISFAMSLIFYWPVWNQVVLAVATCLSYLPRALAAIRFRQSWLGAFLHPLGVAWFVSLQWLALVNQAIGKPIPWRGRA